MPVGPRVVEEPHDHKQVVRLATSAMGTRFEFVLEGPDPVRLRAAGEAALVEVVDLHRALSAFDPASDVSRLNRDAASGWVRIQPRLFDLLCLCQEVWRASGGTFDITIGPLMAAWGFRGGGRPDPAAIAAARRCTGFDKVELDPTNLRVRYLNPGVQIDLGAVGKGLALDAAADVLREAGVTRAFLHGGTSSCLAIGAPAADDASAALPGWGVQLGRDDDAPLIALRDATLGLSAPHGRMIEGDRGEPLGHILDPRTGRPTRAARQAAALAPSAALADAWSTAALVLGAAPPIDNVSLGVQLDHAGSAGWTFQGCWPLMNPRPRDRAVAPPASPVPPAGVC